MKLFTVMGTDTGGHSWLWGSFSTKRNAKRAIELWHREEIYFDCKDYKFSIVRDNLDDFHCTKPI